MCMRGVGWVCIRGWVYEGSRVGVYKGSVEGGCVQGECWVCTGVMNRNIGVAALCYSVYSAQPVC